MITSWVYLFLIVLNTHFIARKCVDSRIQHSHFYKNYTFIMMENTADRCEALKKTLSEWEFSKLKLLELPLDEIQQNYVRRNVIGAVFSRVSPTPLKKDRLLVSYSEDALVNILDMHPIITKTSEFVDFVSGNNIIPSCFPLAHRYGGHQFGTWAMQLGDGRAHLLGEYVNSKGEHWELQLKGSGMTPYSRDGDGRAVLRSSVREFLCSEAMHYLRIPTSRAVTIVMSDDPVQRDQFYNGFPQTEKAAVVLRLAPTWFRFGSLELLARQGELSTLKTLTDFIIKEHFRNINLEDENKYLQLFNEVAHKTLDLVAAWQGVGFTHGVLNTDNMSLLGITIDYGPFGFLDNYRERYIPNNSDKEGRYSYIKQPEIALWNLEKLAQALSVLLNSDKSRQLMELVLSLESYADRRVSQVFRKKLGLSTDQPGDMELTKTLLSLMEETGTDFTMGFRQLGEVSVENLLSPEIREKKWALKILATGSGFQKFIDAYTKRISLEPELTEEKRQSAMMNYNPRYVLRQWMVQSAIAKAENGDFTEVNDLLEILQDPYRIQGIAEDKGFSLPPPAWSKHIKVSCSS